MRLDIVFSFLFATCAVALPHHLVRDNTSSGLSKRGSEDSWYDGFIALASVALGHTIAPYLTRYSALTLAFGPTCESGLSFNPHDLVCEPPTRSVPVPSHPSGHGVCSEGQFWFGPKQICVDKSTSEATTAPAGYYCPLDWHYSLQQLCCIPNMPEAIRRNNCKNGNGTWDLIRL
ncbi:hypothetical protein RhiJN_27128 [Ceratobasidium sp. AG-Ba]|nr:hypothetical protein RhiJN_27128 [Ceratobasidium sp. AG-Ba]